MFEKLAVVVPAGGMLDGDSIPKAFLTVDEHSLLDAAVRAVLQCPLVSGRIHERVLVTDPTLARHCHYDRLFHIVSPGSTLLESVQAGVRDLRADRPVLCLFGDQPMATSEAVTDFVERCRGTPNADVWVGYVSKENAERVLPGFGHTYARIDGQRYCMAGVALLRPGILWHPAVQDLMEVRKNIPKIAKRLGVGTVLRYLLGRLTKQGIEQALGWLLGGITVVGIESPYGELTVDIDNKRRLERYRRWSMSRLRP